MAQAPPSAGAHAPAPVRAAPVRASPPAGASGAIQCAQVVRPPVVAMAASVGSPSAIQEAAGVGSEPSVLMARIAQRDAQIAGLRAEVNMANAEIARLRDAVAAMPPRGPPRTETEAGPAPGVPAPGGGIVARPMPPPVNTLARPYRLVQVNPERFPHQRQVMRDGAVRLIVDKRRLLYLVVQLQDEYGRPADPFDLQPRGPLVDPVSTASVRHHGHYDTTCNKTASPTPLRHDLRDIFFRAPRASSVAPGAPDRRTSSSLIPFPTPTAPLDVRTLRDT